MIGRRMALGGAAATLGGCGFRPLYLPQSGEGRPAAAELAAVYVPVLPERPGQLLRQALQRRLEGAGSGTAKRYELTAYLVASGEGVATQRDSSTTRVRLNATGPWYLRTLNLDRALLAQGSSRIVDGYNILNQQYFAADLENDAAIKRIAEALADQIVTQVAVFLSRQPPAPA